MRKTDRTHWLVVAGVLAILALGALGGCGGDDDDDEGGGADTQAATGGGYGAGGGGGGEDEDAGGGEGTVPVSLTEFEIDPANPTVEAGTVTFDVTNDGAAPHNLEVEGMGVEEELDQDLAGGESGQLTVELTEPGTYEWYCPVGDHADQGMEGELTVN